MSFVNMGVIGEEEMRRRFAVLASRGPEQLGLPRVMVSEAEGVMRDSRPLVPVVTGTLALERHGRCAADHWRRGDGDNGLRRRSEALRFQGPRESARRSDGRRLASGKKYYPRPGLLCRILRSAQWKFLETAVPCAACAYPRSDLPPRSIDRMGGGQWRISSRP